MQTFPGSAHIKAKLHRHVPQSATSCEAYAIMLHKMTHRYPDAEVYCMTMTARRDPDKADSYADVGQPTAFHAELTKIIERFGCTAVDLENCGIDKQAQIFDAYMGDGCVHPNAAGQTLYNVGIYRTYCQLCGRCIYDILT